MKLSKGGKLCLFTGVTLSVITLIVWVGVGHANLAETTGPDWSHPGPVSLLKIGDVPATPSHPNYLSNMDCQTLTYRTTTDKTMQTGCFTNTAFGLYDTGSRKAIFNGTDEAVDLLPYGNNQILVPWPHSGSLIVLDTVNTGGSHLKLQKNALHLGDQRDYLDRLVSKKLLSPPDLIIRDQGGNPIVINAKTLAFSSGGSWLVAETLTGSFIRMNLATLDITYFAQSFAASGFPGTYQSQVAISDDGRFVAIGNEASLTFKVYDLKRCPQAISPPQTRCEANDYRSFVADELKGIKKINHIRFVNEDIITFEAIAQSPQNDGTYLISPHPTIPHLIDYLAMGDSYTSGEGVFNYKSGTDTGSNHCHNSGLAYPALVTRDIFSPKSGFSVACSGARITDINNLDSGYVGQVDGGKSYDELRKDVVFMNSLEINFTPGYIAQLRFAKKYQPKILMVSAGGNDVGFGEIVKTCVAPHLSLRSNANTCFNTYEDRQELLALIERTGSKWKTLFVQLKSASPRSSVYAVGYPDIVSEKGGCALNVHLDDAERMFTRELVKIINSRIENSAKEAGVSYVDISKALEGHRLCETKSYNVGVNGLTSGKDAGIFGVEILGSESYHPNALGHQLIAQSILRATNNLNTRNDTTPTPITNSSFLDKQKVGRPISSIIPATIVKKPSLGRSQNINISLTDTSLGIAAIASYEIGFKNSFVVLGNTTSNIDGSITAEVKLPDDTPNGFQTLVIKGQGIGGNKITLTQLVFIEFSPNDYDGDGTDNDKDSCPYSSLTSSSELICNDELVEETEDDQEINSEGATPEGPSNQSPPSASLDKTLNPQTPANSSLSTSQLSSAPQTASPTLQEVKPLNASILGEAKTITPQNILAASMSNDDTPSHIINPEVTNWLRLSTILIFAWWLVLFIYTYIRSLRFFRSHYA